MNERTDDEMFATRRTGDMNAPTDCEGEGIENGRPGLPAGRGEENHTARRVWCESIQFACFSRHKYFVGFDLVSQC